MRGRNGFGQQSLRGSRLGQAQAQGTRPHRACVGGRRGGDDATGGADGGRDGASPQQRASQFDRLLVVGRAEDSGEVLAVPAARRRAQLDQSDIKVGARGVPSFHPGDAQHRGRVAQHPHRGLLHVGQRRAGLLPGAVGDPLEIVDHPHQRSAARGQPDRPEVGAEEVGAQRVHRLGDIGGGRAPFEPVGQGAAGLGGVASQFSVVTRREDEQRRGHAHRQRDGPTEQSFVDRSRWRASR